MGDGGVHLHIFMYLIYELQAPSPLAELLGGACPLCLDCKDYGQGSSGTAVIIVYGLTLSSF
jgi:hypothetical protein